MDGRGGEVGGIEAEEGRETTIRIFVRKKWIFNKIKNVLKKCVLVPFISKTKKCSHHHVPYQK